jgi:hypothetical protein
MGYRIPIISLGFTKATHRRALYRGEVSHQYDDSQGDHMAEKKETVKATDHAAEHVETGLTGRTEYPGQTMGIVALVLAFFIQIPALILGIIAWVWSNKAQVNNVQAKVAVAVSSVLIVLGALAVIGWIVLVASTVGELGDLGMWDGMGPRGLRS